MPAHWDLSEKRQRPNNLGKRFTNIIQTNIVQSVSFFTNVSKFNKRERGSTNWSTKNFCTHPLPKFAKLTIKTLKKTKKQKFCRTAIRKIDKSSLFLDCRIVDRNA